MRVSVSKLIVVPIVVGLILTMLINGIALISGGSEAVGMFMNFYNRAKIENLPLYSTPTLLIVSVLQIASALLLVVSLIKREFIFSKETNNLKWGVFIGILSVVLYGFAVRMISNHQAAANLFFYTGLLYLLLWYIEKNSSSAQSLFEKIKTLPIFFTLFYTMGQPGIQKLFNAVQVIPRYEAMFKDSFLVQLPGGISPFIYILGILEIAVPILLAIGIVKFEFLPTKNKVFLSLAILVSALTFIMLSFGLTVLINYPGATNLIFYAIFCLFFYEYCVVKSDENNTTRRMI